MSPQCDHPTPSGPCERRVGDDDEVCFLHDESGPPSSHGAPEGNDHAVGNAGGGAPAQNTNAEIHGGFADLELLAERLDDSEQEHVDRLAAAAVDRSEQNAPEMDSGERERLARRYALLDVQLKKAEGDLAGPEQGGRGIAVQREVTVEMDGGPVTGTGTALNPVWDVQHRIRQRQRRLAQKLSLFGGK